VEAQFSPAALALTVAAPAEASGHGSPGEVDLGGHRVRYRLPTVADAIALAETAAPDGRGLLRRCIIDADSDALPEFVLAEIAGQIAIADPCADILLDLACPSCGHRWNAPFDTVAVLWAEIDAWARRTLHEVVALARSFGWSEGDILAMSPQRRADYLALNSR
jgi:hypothetical protein